MISEGDYVVYAPMREERFDEGDLINKDIVSCEVGIVMSVDSDNGVAFVKYTIGDTAAATNIEDLHIVQNYPFLDQLTNNYVLKKLIKSGSVQVDKTFGGLNNIKIDTMVSDEILRKIVEILNERK